MRGRTRSILLSSLVCSSLAALPSAESRQQPSVAGSKVVIRAITAEGQPVVDLTAADVNVRVDGREREVSALDLVRPTATGGGGAPAPPVPAPYATNAAAAAATGAREFMVAIDDEGIAAGRDSVVREAVATLVASLGPADAVGVVSMRRGGSNLAPTLDRSASDAALGKIVAAGSTTESVNDFGCRTKAVLANLRSMLEGAPAKRTVLLFSSGVTTPTGDTIRESLGKQQDADEAICQVRQRELDDLGRAASVSPAAVVVVFVPEAVANVAHLKTGEAGLENIAGVTGGEMVRLVGSAGPAMTRIAETSGVYYLATLEGEADAGEVRRVEARVNRDGIRVSARPLTAGSAATTAKAGSPRDMLRVPTVYRELPLRAAGFVSRQPGASDLKVVALFEPDDPTLKLTAAMIGLFDEKGTLKAQWTAQPNELGRSPVVAALTAAPGKYRMRVAASDSSGKGGTTDYDLAVRLSDAPPVRTSDMLLGVGQGGFAPRLAFTAADAAAIGFIEIYGVQKDAKVDVTFEIVNGTEVMGSGQGTIGAGPGEDARIAYGGFGIATLAPGDYTMRASISVDGKPAGVATHTLRKLK